MSPTTSFLTRVGRSGAVGLVLMAVGGVSVAAGLARTTTSTPEGKVFVCKYVGTPGDDERLQTGQNPISVSINAIKDYQGPGSFFDDAHGRSYVLALDTGQPEPDVSECPGPSSSTTTASTSTTTTTSVDGSTSTTVDEPTTTTTLAENPTTTTTVEGVTTTTTVDEPTTTTTTTVDEPTTTTTTPSANEPTTTTTVPDAATTTTAVDDLTPTTQSETKGASETISTTTPAMVGPNTTSPTAAAHLQTETLPLTGGASVPLVAIGSMLFAAGAAMTIVAMRRRRAA